MNKSAKMFLLGALVGAAVSHFAMGGNIPGMDKK